MMPPLLMAFFIILFLSGDLLAQRITYESLRMRDRQPYLFLEHLAVPNPESDEVTLVSQFRLENNFLNFRRYQGDTADGSRQFYAEPTVRLNIRKRSDDDSDQRQDSRTRTWSETVYTETYEQTQSSTTFVQNLLKTSLQPGTYRIESTASSNSRSRQGVTSGLRIPDQDDTDFAILYFLDKQSESISTERTPLMNMGRNVYFGRDHQIAIWFPAIKEESEYTMKIEQLRTQRRDTSVVRTVSEYTLDPQNFLSGLYPQIDMHNDRPHFELLDYNGSNETGFFYLVHIPNSTFENAHYRLRLYKSSPEGEEKTLVRRTYQSLWLDMPVSLLNLDIAIQMMEFILDDEAHREMRRGSQEQKERRFREYWKERDPSPDREYNELMVEYFRRIDYAFENFSTPQKRGYESDQGKIYIRNGEPNRKERTFPPGGTTREVWHYSNRTYVFEATTGFGDYRLIEQR